MSDLYQKPYLESSAWIGLVKGEIINGIDRKHIIEHILRAAEVGNYPIFTSSLTLAEVHKSNSASTLSNREDERILEFFEHEYIQLIDVDRSIGEHSNRLCREHRLNPCDAIHLASALRAKCDYLLTWDNHLLRCKLPLITIEEPQIRGQAMLFDAPTGS